jgi:hypothetical protein
MITAEFVKNGIILKQLKDIKYLGCRIYSIEVNKYLEEEPIA